MKKLVFYFFSFHMMLLLISACDKDDKPSGPADPGGSNGTGDIEGVYTYIGAGSYGDVITYEIDHDNNIISFINETTGQTGQGSFVLSSEPVLEGLYEITIGGSIYYGIESPGKSFATSLPSGNSENVICFALSADHDLSEDYLTGDIAGKYISINYHDLGGDPDIMFAYEIFANGTYTWGMVPDDPSDFGNQHFGGGGSGTWEICETDPSRIIFLEDGIEYIGAIYPGEIMIIDNGYGYGFQVGVRYPDTPITVVSVAGKYRFIDVTVEGYLGYGYFEIPPTGNEMFVWSHYPAYPELDEIGTGTEFVHAGNFNNAFWSDYHLEDDGQWYVFHNGMIILPGELMLYFCWGEHSGIVSFGIASMIN